MGQTSFQVDFPLFFSKNSFSADAILLEIEKVGGVFMDKDIEMLLKAISACDIKGLGVESVYDNLIMKKNQEILNQHAFKISECKDGRFRTFLPNEQGKKGREVRRRTREELLEYLVKYYEEESKLTFKAYYDETIKERVELYNLSNNTLSKYKTDYARFLAGTVFETRDIRTITFVEIDQFFKDTILGFRGKNKYGGLSYKAFSRLFEYVSWVFFRAKRQQVVDNDPMLYLKKRDYQKICSEGLPKTAETETLDMEQIDILMEQVLKDEEKSFYPPAWGVHFAALTGLRVGEVAVVQWADVHLEYEIPYISIHSSDRFDRINKEWSIGPTKTGKARVIPVDSYIEEFLARLRNAHQASMYKDSGFLFPGEGGWTHSNRISSYIRNKRKLLKNSEKKTFRGVHGLRKTLNSELRNQNASAQTACSLLGNSLDTNNRYYTFDRADIMEKRAFLEKTHEYMHLPKSD